ncbi:unnamed protein product [Macrosiphum euphorbiae]|nr:unnamed protein product [Macrosiphum euphorbiae]
MVRCCVINCLSHNEKNKKISLFTLPKNPNIRKKWINVLSEVNGKDILSTSRVCELHFNPWDISRTYSCWSSTSSKTTLESTETAETKEDFLQRTIRPKLNTNAIPSIFEVKHSQKAPQSPAACCKKLDWSDEPFTIKPQETSLQVVLIDSFKRLLENVTNINLPVGWNYFYDQTAVIYYFIKHECIQEVKAVIERKIVLTSESIIRFYAYDKLIDKEQLLINLQYPFNLTDLERVFIMFYQKQLCVGGPNALTYPR